MTTTSARTAVSRLSGLVAAALTVACVGLSAPAGAVGDPSLSQQIVSPTQSGWSSYPSSQVLALVKKLTSQVDLSLADVHGTATVAAQLWRNSHGYLEIGLFSIASTTGKNPDLNARVLAFSAQAPTRFCANNTGVAPIKTGTIPQIPTSVVGECAASNNKQYVVISWSRHNVMALIVAPISALSLKDMVTLAKSQYRAMKNGTASSGASSSTLIVVIAGAVVLVGLLVTVLRRRSSPSTQS